MTGNVWEWTHDWHDENYYKKSPKNNPEGPETGKARVVRGGSWLRDPCEDPCVVPHKVVSRYPRRWCWVPPGLIGEIVYPFENFIKNRYGAEEVFNE